MLQKVVSPSWSGHIREMLSEVEDGIFDLQDFSDDDPLDLDWWYIVDNNEKISGIIWISYYTDDFFYCNKGHITELSFYISPESRNKGLLNETILNIEKIINDEYKDATLILAVVKKTNPYYESVQKAFKRAGYLLSENSRSYLLQKDTQ